MSPAGDLRPLAVVTGASSGIGKELARALAERGHDLCLVADTPDLPVVASELEATTGVEVYPQQADLAEAGNVEGFVALVRSLRRPVALAALNAGVGVGGRFDEIELEDDLRVIAVNVTATVHLAKLLARDMVHVGEGRLLLTSSVASRMPGPGQATYAASKAFVESFGEAIRHELADLGVSVTTLLPGPTDTAFFDRAGMADTRLARGPKTDPAEVARQGVEALLAGKTKVVPGSTLIRAQTVVSGLLPDKLTAAVHAGLTKRKSD